MPTHLSPEARNLINGMLAVDPVKRITVPQIIEHPFFTSDLPRYLSPLPPPPGPIIGPMSSLVTPAKPLDFEIIEGLGRIEEDVVDELASKLEGVDKKDVWDCLRRDDGPQGNTVKVAYMLLRDKHRLGHDCRFFIYAKESLLTHLIVAEFMERERDAELAAMDVSTASGYYTKYSVLISPEIQSPPTHSHLGVEILKKIRSILSLTTLRMTNWNLTSRPLRTKPRTATLPS